MCLSSDEGCGKDSQEDDVLGFGGGLSDSSEARRAHF